MLGQYAPMFMLFMLLSMCLCTGTYGSVVTGTDVPTVQPVLEYHLHPLKVYNLIYVCRFFGELS